jgi:hypothetical protein
MVAGCRVDKASDLSNNIIDVRTNVILEVIPSFSLLAYVDRSCTGENWSVYFGQPVEHPVGCGVLRANDARRNRAPDASER